MKPIVLRRDVTASNNYEDYRQDLRADFWYSCAYCSRAEAEAQGIGYQIDHYLPQEHFADLENEYINLYYACQKCNRNKGDLAPCDFKTENERFLRIDIESPDQHIAYDADGKLKSKTALGDFNIRVLKLNAAHLIKLRKIRAQIAQNEKLIRLGFAALRAIPLDSLPANERFQKLKNEALAKTLLEDLRATVEEFIVQNTKSPYLDPDDTADELNKERRSYLKDKKTLAPQPKKARQTH